MSLTQLLQQRLEEESVVVKAAEGLSPEQILLAIDIECSAKMKRIKAIQDDVRSKLKEWHNENVLNLETGEALGEESLMLGDVVYAPKVATNREWDVVALVAKHGEKALPFLTVSAGRVTDAIKAGVYTWDDFEGCYTATRSLTHGTKQAK